MILAIDVGNTNIVLAVYNDQEKLEQWRAETHQRCCSEQSENNQLMVEYVISDITVKYHDIDSIIICSVVPAVNEDLAEVCQKHFGTMPVFITHENIDLDIDIDNPKQLGTDRMVGALAAVKHYGAPVIVVDFGTSTNFDVIDENGTHCGGVLATGANLSLSALEQAAAQLPKIDIEKPKNIVGRNTIDAMQSGIYWGYVSMVEGIVERIKKEKKLQNVKVVATGGLAVLFKQGTEIFDFEDQDLIMKGLVHMHTVIKEGRA